MSENHRRFFFVHLQKTAGVSLRTRLQHQFGDAAVYPDASDVPAGFDGAVEAIASIKYLQRRYDARRDELRVITGHFPLCAADLLGGGFTTLTVLREPVDRILSFLRHRQALVAEDHDKSLEQIYADARTFDALIHNHAVKMLSLTAEEPNPTMFARVEFTPDRLQRAKERLASVDAIGLQERFDEFCEYLERRFGWDLGDPRRINETRATEVPEEFRARIAADNAMDVELYEFGRELYRERRSTPAPA